MLVGAHCSFEVQSTHIHFPHIRKMPSPWPSPKRDVVCSRSTVPPLRSSNLRSWGNNLQTINNYLKKFPAKNYAFHWLWNLHLILQHLNEKMYAYATIRYKIFEPILLLGNARFSTLDIRVRVTGGGTVGKFYGKISSFSLHHYFFLKKKK